MNDKSILELAVDLAFKNAEIDIHKSHAKALRGIAERLEQLKNEVQLIQQAEVSNDRQ